MQQKYEISSTIKDANEFIFIYLFYSLSEMNLTVTEKKSTI